MKMKKIACAIALCLAAGSSNAGFLDNRAADAVIEVNYKSIAVEDLVADIVPRDMRTDYVSPELRKRHVRISGKGTWSQLLERALQQQGLSVKRTAGLDKVERLEVYSSSATASAIETGVVHGAALPSAGSVAKRATAAVPVVPVDQWEIKPGASLRSTLEAWCDRANHRLVWNLEGGFRSQGGLTAEGDFKKAVAELFAAVPQDLHLRVEITKNKLVVVTKGD